MQSWYELAAQMSRDATVANKQRYETRWVVPRTALLSQVTDALRRRTSRGANRRDHREPVPARPLRDLAGLEALARAAAGSKARDRRTDGRAPDHARRFSELGVGERPWRRARCRRSKPPALTICRTATAQPRAGRGRPGMRGRCASLPVVAGAMLCPGSIIAASMYMSSLRQRCFDVEKFVPLLMTGGLFAHLVNIAHYLETGRAGIREVLRPLVDGTLTTLMVYCAIGLVVSARRFFRRFSVTSRWRKVVYGLVTFYVCASVPGHVRYLATGDTSYFDIFPWWFSLVIMPVYLLVIAYFFTLPPPVPSRSQSPRAV
jgi:hypothetical protein